MTASSGVEQTRLHPPSPGLRAAQALVLVLSVLILPGCGYHPPTVSSCDEVRNLGESHVALRVRSLPDDDIPCLQHRTDLQMLFFSDGWCVGEALITDRGLEKLSRLRLPHLVLLDLGHCGKITDAGLASVSRIPNLTRLSLSGCPGVTDGGLRHLTKIGSLQQLDLRGCPRVTDRGLLCLAPMKQLRWLQLGGCPEISAAGVAELRALLPDSKIEKDELEWSRHR